VIITGVAADRDTYILTASSRIERAKALRLEVLPDPTLPGERISRGGDGTVLLTGLELEAGPAGEPGLFVPVPFGEAAAEHGSNPKGVLDDDPATAWSVSGESGAAGTQLVLVAREPFGYAAGTCLRIRLRHESSEPGRTIGRFRLSLTAASDAASSVRLPTAIQAILAKERAERSAAEARRLEEYYLSISPLLAPVREWRDRLSSLWAELAHPVSFAMSELPEPRKTWVLLGGSFLSHGKEVTPGVPAVLNRFPEDAPRNRLGLARWIVEPGNPLTARVAVNRAWMEFFGRGIVETVEDFGTQGRPPSHPALLDWLACELIERKWSMKAMHRLIVGSATYRQDSLTTPELNSKDPSNIWLARSPRPRLEAEMIRDSALFVAGLLSTKMGGPSVFPFQPEGIWNLVYNDDKWRISDGEDRYRRGIYTFWRRTAPYPMFTAFDAPSREVTCTRRVATNTPLQSLTMLNDPVFVDAARGLARRVLLEGPPGNADRVGWLFRLCLAREPLAKEAARLEGLVASETKEFRRTPAKGEELANGGDVRPPAGSDPVEFAAWTVAANVVLNLDEFLTRP